MHRVDRLAGCHISLRDHATFAYPDMVPTPHRELPLPYDDDSQDGVSPRADEEGSSVNGLRHDHAGPVFTTEEEARTDLPARTDDGDVASRVGRNGAGDQVGVPGLGALEIEDRQALVQFTSSWQGPLPPPQVFAQYESVVPGAAERILAMTEKVATGHIDNEAKLVAAEIETAKQGQAFALLLTLIAIIAAIVFFAIGNPLAGGVLLSFPVVMIVRSFLGQYGGAKEPKDQQKEK